MLEVAENLIFRGKNIEDRFFPLIRASTVQNTVVPGFRVLGFSALPGFRALKAAT